MLSAIFLLVVLAALAGYMVSFSGVQHTTSAQDLLGSQAYHAAETGNEWGRYQVLKRENENGVPYECPAITTLHDLGGALAGIMIVVDCTLTEKDEGGNVIRTYQFKEGANVIRTYQFKSTASYGTKKTPDYVERQVTTTVETCRKDGTRC
jgi:MSHA biogenesis protein MshP